MKHNILSNISRDYCRICLLVLLCVLGTGLAKAQLPDDFQKVELLTELKNTINFEFAPDGRIFLVDRYGELLIYKPVSQTLISAGSLPVFHDLEDGLLAIAFDPNFEVNNFIYLHYSPLNVSVNRVSRFNMNGDNLDLNSEIILLEWPTQREGCCHSAGDMDFDSNGNLYIATGDNTDHSPYAALNEINYIKSSEKSSSNTNDLRGKILRITPQLDGTYTIPPDNLFPGGVGGLEEIYVMGARNPFKIFVDKETTDWLYWGEVGPDANGPDPVRGPGGYDEINLVKSAGNYGWPYFTGDNEPHLIDYTNPTYYNDPNAPVNVSTWNTGATNLPPARPAWITFDHDCWLAGPRYYYDPTLTDQQRLPIEFDGAFFYFDFNRSKIWVAQTDTDGNILNQERFAVSEFPNSTETGFIDLKTGPDGHLYILEYGTGCCANNTGTGKLSRVDYIGIVSNSSPVISLTADPTNGSLPLTVDFSTAGTYDPDGDPLTYEWDFQTDGTIDSNLPNPSFTYNSSGTFNAQLVVKDDQGGQSVRNTTIQAGNNSATFTFNSPVDGGFVSWSDDILFDLQVDDVEDGSTSSGGIDCQDVNVVPSLGHLSHFHDDLTLDGCPKTLNLDPTEHDIYGEMDIYYVLNVNYTDQGGLISFDQIQVHPKRMEAEFYDTQSGITVIGNSDPWGGGSGVVRADHDSHIVFSGRNLANITSVKYRVQSQTAGSTIELRTGSPTGPLLTTTNVPVTGSNWEEVETNLTDPGGKNDLYFVFKNSSGQQSILDLNWIEVVGPGVSQDNTPPNLVGIEALTATSVLVEFSEYVSSATSEVATNYSIDNGVSISSAILQQDGRTVLLTTSPISSGITHNVSISNVENLAGLAIAPTNDTFILSAPTRINSGGPQLIFDGIVYDADQYASGGSTFTSSVPINQTLNDELYQTERFGNFFYEIPVPQDGSYDVNLHFSENYFGVGGNTGGVGSRVFNVNIENGQKSLSSYDIIAAAGAPATAVVEAFTDIDVSDGFLTINFTGVVNNAKISAIEVFDGGSLVLQPSIDIFAPSNGASVNQPFNVNFTLSNWEVETGGTHIHKIVDGVNIGPHYSLDPVVFDTLSLGSHTIRLELYQPNHTGTGVYDEIVVNVTDQSVCGSSTFPSQWQGYQIDAELPYRSIYILPYHDIDGDGLKDIATGAWWYKNPGSASGNWVKKTVGAPFNQLAYIHDFDGDGDMDLFGTQGTYTGADLVWAENDGLGNFTIHTNIPSGTTTHHTIFIAGIAGGVYQSGGPFQLAITWNGGEEGNSQVQMVTVPSDPVNDPWTIQNIHPTSLGEGLSNGDIDRDGDLDLFQAGNWLRNDGGTWTLISTGVTLATKFDRNVLTDINGDGLLDGVAGQIGNDQEVVWMQAPPDPTQNWTKFTIDPDIDGGLSVGTADMDFDGDQDVIVGEWKEGHQLFGFENDLCNSGTWIKHIIDAGGNLDHHDGSQIVDIDNDGDLDIITIGWSQVIPRIFENQSGVPSVNLPPLLGSQRSKVFIQGEDVYIQMTGSDPNGDPITFSATGLPTSVTINSGTGVISGTLDPGVSGDFPVTVRATDDGGLYQEINFTISIENHNNLFRINSGGTAFSLNGEDWIDDQYFQGGNTFSNSNSITGTNKQELYQTERNSTGTVTYQIPVPNGDYLVRLHFAEIFHLTTGSRSFDINVEAGQGQLFSYDILQAAGGPNIAVAESFSVTVNDGNLSISLVSQIDRAKVSGIEVFQQDGSNQAPLIYHPGNQFLNENTAVSIQTEAMDPNIGDNITYSATGLPASLTIDSSSGLISGTIDDPAGDYTVTVTATDDDGLFSQQTFNITVGNFTNIARINAGGPDLNFNGEIWVLDQFFTGGGQFSQANPITNTLNDELYQTERNAVNSFSYNIPVPNTGTYAVRLHFAEVFHSSIGARVFNVSAESGQVELLDYDIISASGGKDIARIETFMVDVNDGNLTLAFTSVTDRAKISGIEVFAQDLPNLPPVLYNPGDQYQNLGAAVSFMLAADDPNAGDQVTFSATGLPGSLTLNTSTGLISGTLDDPAGQYSVSITATDQQGLTDQKEFSIFVGNFTVLNRINAGGPAFSFNGENWEADQFFDVGVAFTNVISIKNTENDQLYHTERNTPTGSLIYDIPVAIAGDFIVRLHMAEIFHSTPGSRVFDVDIENGQGILSDLDIISYAGNPAVALVESFNVSVTDGSLTIAFTSQTDRAKISGIEVLSVDNIAPVVVNPGDQTYDEMEMVDLQISASDADAGDVLVFSATNLPENLTIDQATGLISGQLNVPPGDYQVAVRATDNGGLFDEESFTISVGDVEFPPVLDDIADQIVAEGGSLDLIISASDMDGEIPALTAQDLPAFMTFNDLGDGTGTASINPGFTDVGTYNVTFIATDNGGLSDQQLVMITVTETNGVPVLNAVGDQVVAEGSTLDVNITATDPDGDDPAISTSQLPPFASFTDNGDGTASLSLSPGFNDFGSYNITITATDSEGVTDEEIILVTVTETNAPPQLDPIGNQTVSEGSILELSISASDPDNEIPVLEVTGLPPFATFVDNNDGTGTLTVSPGYTDVGIYNLTVTATDMGGLSAEEIISVSVEEVNAAPQLTAVGDQSVPEGQELNLTLEATDPDGEIPVISANGLPPFATLTNNNDGTSLLNIAPGYTDVGSYQITIMATDVLGLVDSEEIMVSVTEVNGQPMLANILDQTLEEGTSKVVTITATDPDGELPEITVENLQPFMTLNVNGGGTATLELAPDFNEFGNYTITVRATDTGGLFDEQQVGITVTEITSNPDWVVSSQIENANCLNEAGYIELQVSGGFGQIEYLWSNGETTKDIYELSSGVYTVNITDQKNNTTSESFTINTQPGPQKPVITRDENNLVSSPAANYQWKLDGQEIEGATGQTVEITLAGEYSVTISDVLGCQVDSDPLPVAFEFSEISIYPNPTDGEFTIELVLKEDEVLTFILIDDVGRETPIGVYDLRAGRHELPVSLNDSFANGVYLLLNDGKNFQSNVTRIALIR